LVPVSQFPPAVLVQLSGLAIAIPLIATAAITASGAIRPTRRLMFDPVKENRNVESTPPTCVDRISRPPLRFE
jgi:hypothetical protein